MIPAIRRQRQEDHYEVEASLGYSSESKASKGNPASPKRKLREKKEEKKEGRKSMEGEINVSAVKIRK